jgi:hypothetical protein
MSIHQTSCNEKDDINQIAPVLIKGKVSHNYERLYGEMAGFN